MSEDSHSSTRDRVAALLSEGLTVTQVAQRLGVSKPTVRFHKRQLGIPPDGKFSRRYDWSAIRADYEAGLTMKACQAKYGFSGAAWTDAVARGDIEPRPRAASATAVFVSGHKRSRYHLKARLLATGVKAPRCEECGISDWRRRPLALELHHVNGDGYDNRVENLQLLCPNCHSQTDNWGGKAKLRAA